MIRISVTRTVPIGPIPTETFVRGSTMVLKGEKKRHARIHAIILNDGKIRKINEKFLHHNGATDVITFPLESEPVLEAEIYISVDTARRQAKNFHVSLTNELMRLTMHGLLHLCGYDDGSERDRLRMRGKENFYVETFFSRSKKKHL